MPHWWLIDRSAPALPHPRSEKADRQEEWHEEVCPASLGRLLKPVPSRRLLEPAFAAIKSLQPPPPPAAAAKKSAARDLT